MLTRRLLLVAQAGPSSVIVNVQHVIVNIQHPVEELDCWRCDYEIVWPDATRRSSGRGVDGIQAILLTLEKIGIELYTSDAFEEGRLRWFDDDPGVGFPLSSGVRDIAVGRDKLL